MTAELVACPKCARSNSPLRQSCIYCGAQLPVAQEVSAQLVAARAALTHERSLQKELDPLSQISTQLQQSLSGFTVVLMPTADNPEKAIEALTAATRFTDIEARQVLGFAYPMPLTRLQYEVEAKAIQEQLQAAGLRTLVVSDEKLQPGAPNRRIRRFTVDGDTLNISLENKYETSQKIAAKEVRLIVEGKIRYRQFQTTEQNKGFGKTERELTDAVEFVEEQPIVDLYTTSLDTSFRVRAESFDYSGLGSKMKLTAIENFRMLVATLREAAPSAIYDGEFKQCAKLLELVWPSTSRNESLGLRRSQMLSVGKISTRSIHHIDNEMQFNRYSRLRYYLMSAEHGAT